jgi:hypothetical protein
MPPSELSEFYFFSGSLAAQKFYASRHADQTGARATPPPALLPWKTAPYPAFLQLNVSYVKYLGVPGPPEERLDNRGISGA